MGRVVLPHFFLVRVHDAEDRTPPLVFPLGRVVRVFPKSSHDIAEAIAIKDFEVPVATVATASFADETSPVRWAIFGGTNLRLSRARIFPTLLGYRRFLRTRNPQL